MMVPAVGSALEPANSPQTIADIFETCDRYNLTDDVSLRLEADAFSATVSESELFAIADCRQFRAS